MQMAVVAGIVQVGTDRQLVVRVRLTHGGNTSSRGAVSVSGRKAGTGKKVVACRYVRRVRRRYLGRHARYLRVRFSRPRRTPVDTHSLGARAASYIRLLTQSECHATLRFVRECSSLPQHLKCYQLK